MNIVRNGDITLLKFKALEKIDFIKHAVSTRSGGVSTLKGLESLNLGFHTKDSPDNVRENYRRFCKSGGFDVKKLVLAQQTHSTNVRYATYDDAGKGVFKQRDYTDIDALVTDKPGLPLVIHTADCVPVGFVDVKKRVIGNAHCGWRGTFGLLAEKTIREMSERFRTDANDLVCVMGPCICQKCYEVSKDLYLQFKHRFPLSDSLVFENEKFFIDLAMLNREILIESGVKPENIFVSDICTCCNKDYMFSHRGQGPERGILASCISIV